MPLEFWQSPGKQARLKVVDQKRGLVSQVFAFESEGSLESSALASPEYEPYPNYNPPPYPEEPVTPPDPSIDDWWEDLTDKINQWISAGWQIFITDLEQKIEAWWQAWLAEQQEKLLERLEQAFLDWINPCCGTLLLPMGMATSLWLHRKHKMKRI